MKLELNIPEYLSIKNWKYFKSLDNKTDNAKMIDFISYLSGADVEGIRQDRKSTRLNSSHRL